VTVAGNAKQAQLLCSEISSLQWIQLEGYNLSYSRSALTTRLKIFLQIPKILTAIKREKRWLKRVAEQQKFDLIISDNRFGFHHEEIYSVFITHQLRIRIPLSKWIDTKLQRWNYHFINQFDECWVPDYREATNLA